MSSNDIGITMNTKQMKVLLVLHCLAVSVLGAELSPDLGLGFRRQSEAQYQIDYFREPLSVRGWVVDDRTGIPLDFAVVSLQDTQSTTDEQGYFEFSAVRRENSLLQVSKLNYRTKEVSVHLLKRFDVKTVTLDPIYLTEHDPSVTRFTFGGDTSFGRRFLDPKADEFFPKEEIFCAPDAIIDCNNPLPGSMTLFTWIKPYFAHSDYPVVNLESVVTSSPRDVHQEKDFVFFSLPESLPSLSTELGVRYVNLGNNHLYDYLEAGIEDTLRHLDEQGFAYSGAGHTSDQAYAPYFESIGGALYGFVSATSVSGSQWEVDYIAQGDDKGGAADLRDDELLANAIQLVKDQDAVAIVFPHTGREYSFYPTDYSARRFRAAVQAGADLVIGHHTHVSQGFEVQDGVFIAHCLGNFAFDQSRLETMMALVVEADQRGKETVGASGHPIYIEDYRPRPVVGDIANLYIRRISMYSRNVLVFGYNGEAVIDLHETSQTLEQGMYDESVTISAGKNFAVVDLRGKIPDGASIASIEVSGQPSMVHVGHDIMDGHGNFEDNDVDDDIMEASRWDVSSGSTQVCMEKTFRGVGALCLYRREYNTEDTVVAFRNRIRVEGDEQNLPNKFVTLLGYAQGEEAGAHSIVSRYYSSFGDLTFGEESFSLAAGGTYDWNMFSYDLNMPPDAPGADSVATAARGLRYFIRHSPPPANSTSDGEGVVRIDDVASVNWNIETASSTGKISLATPNNKDFIRIEGTAGATYQVFVTYQRYVPLAPRCDTEVFDNCPPGSSFEPTPPPTEAPTVVLTTQSQPVLQIPIEEETSGASAYWVGSTISCATMIAFALVL